MILLLLTQGVMNGRNPTAALRHLQQQEGMPHGPQAALSLKPAVPCTTVAVADAAQDDASSVSSAGGTPQPLLQTLQEVDTPAGKLQNGTAAHGAAAAVARSAVAGSSAAGDAYSDESVDGSCSAVVQPSVAAVADEVRTLKKLLTLYCLHVALYGSLQQATFFESVGAITCLPFVPCCCMSCMLQPADHCTVGPSPGTARVT